MSAAQTPTQTMDAWNLVAAIEGPRLSIPVALVSALGDLRAAAFLQQAAFLSARARESDGWFFLAQTGEADDSLGSTLFARLGSWQAILGISPDTQLAIRRKLRGLGLLDEALRGVPARLHYRVHPERYLSFLGGDMPPASGEPGNKFPENPETGFLESRNQGSEKAGTYKSKERKEERKPEIQERVHAQPQAAARPAARPAQQPLSESVGIVFDATNARDVATIDRIKSGFSTGDIREAVSQAQGLDPQARAWPTAVLKILLAQQAAALKPAASKPSAPQAPAWALGAVHRPESGPGGGGGTVIDV
ncbi:hypothetical protein GALL_152120 [mine drainage metagenome]|uniref:Uncharacterized protein n=1 Tax=mine drainage metagenome TaxID=410659 RepID=A0A1J5SRR3_9ZZZZ